MAVIYSENYTIQRRKKQSVTLKTVLYCVSLLPFLGIYALKQLMGETAYAAYQVIAMILLGMLVLLQSRRVILNAYVGTVALLYGWLFLKSAWEHGFSAGIMVNTCAIIFLILLIQVDMREIVGVLSFYFSWILILNLLSLIAGIWTGETMFFLGGKNAFSIFLIPAMGIVWVDSLNRNGTISRWVYAFITIALIEIVWGGSTTGFLVSVVVVLGLAYERKGKLSISFCTWGLVLINIILLWGGRVVLQSSWWIRIAEALNKDVTLTSRLIIWEETISLLKESWLTGLGRGSSVVFLSRWGYYTSTTEVHNVFLELLFQGGIIALFLFGAVFVKSTNKLNVKDPESKVVFLFLAFQMANGLAESVNNQMMLSIYLAMCYAYSHRARFGERK